MVTSPFYTCLKQVTTASRTSLNSSVVDGSRNCLLAPYLPHCFINTTFPAMGLNPAAFLPLGLRFTMADYWTVSTP